LSIALKAITIPQTTLPDRLRKNNNLFGHKYQHNVVIKDHTDRADW